MNFKTLGVVVLPDDDHYKYQRGTLTESGEWVPLLSTKGYQVFNSRTRYLLVDGARKTGKSINIGNRLMRHAYEVDGAIVGIVCKTLKNAKQGVWRDLVEFVLPGWVNAGFVTITQEAVMEPDTKMIKFRIRNAWGTESEFQLHSLPHIENVEAVFKGTRFSAVWISEADQFPSQSIMNILGDQLRMVHLPWDQHQMILDCNPPEGGEDHWIYKAFYVEPHTDPMLRSMRDVIHFGLDDNPFLPPEERDELIAKYKNDPIAYARFVEGKYVKDNAEGHFDGFFMHHIHVVGDVSSADPADHSQLVPDEAATIMLGGWDMGDINHAFGLWVPRLNANSEIAYDKIDEVVSIDEEISLYDFTQVVMERCDFWSNWMLKAYNRRPSFGHWGDSSMFNFSANAARTDADTIFAASEGNIMVRSVTKGEGSVAARIGLTKRLLREGRLYVSASCHHGIDWLRYLKKGTTKGETVKRGSPYKHAFDADSYIWWQEEPIESSLRARPRVEATSILSL